LEAIESVIEEWLGPTFDGAKLAISMPIGNAEPLKKSIREWEDLCDEVGFEYIDSESSPKKSKASKPDRVGYERLREALEVVDWDAEDMENGYAALDRGGLLDDWDEGQEGQDGEDGLDGELAEMRMELAELNLAMDKNHLMEDDDEEDDMEGFDKLLVEAMAIRGKINAKLTMPILIHFRHGGSYV
jgi:hypothetical protein